MVYSVKDLHHAIGVAQLGVQMRETNPANSSRGNNHNLPVGMTEIHLEEPSTERVVQNLILLEALVSPSQRNAVKRSITRLIKKKRKEKNKELGF